MRQGVSLGSIGGVPLRITMGWAVISALMVYSFTPLIRQRLDIDTGAAIIVALAVPILLAVSVLLHELAHGVTAQRLGYDVKEYVITLWGGHTTFTSEINRPGAAAAIAGAGPLVNLALAALAWGLSAILGPITGFLAITLALTNAFVGAFNLLPASPLDGGKLLEALLWKFTNQWLGMKTAGRLGQGMAIVLAGALAFRMYVGNQVDLLTAVAGFFVALIMWQGASQTIKVATARQATEGFSTVRYARLVPSVAPQTPVSEINTFPAVVLSPGSHTPIGIINEDEWRRVPAQLRSTTTADAIHITQGIWIIREATGPQAVSEIAQGIRAEATTFLLQNVEHPSDIYLLDLQGVLLELKARGA